MNCPSCGSPTGEGKKFCADCGSILFAAPWPLSQYVDARIDAVLRERYKEQALLTREAADAAFVLFNKSLRRLALWAGVPLASLTTFFGAWGINTVLDARKKLDDLISPVTTKMERLSESMDTASNRTDQLKLQIETSKARVGTFSDRLEKLEASAKKITRDYEDAKAAAARVGSLQGG